MDINQPVSLEKTQIFDSSPSSLFAKVAHQIVENFFDLQDPEEKAEYETLSKKLQGKEKFFFHILIQEESVNEDFLNSEVLSTLLKEKVFHASLVNEKDSQGLTALHYAVIHNMRDPELFNDLIQQGGNPNITDKEGKTVLDYLIDEVNKYKKSGRDKYDNEGFLNQERFLQKISLLTDPDSCCVAKTSRDISSVRSPSIKIVLTPHL